MGRGLGWRQGWATSMWTVCGRGRRCLVTRAEHQKDVGKTGDKGSAPCVVGVAPGVPGSHIALGTPQVGVRVPRTPGGKAECQLHGLPRTPGTHLPEGFSLPGQNVGGLRGKGQHGQCRGGGQAEGSFSSAGQILWVSSGLSPSPKARKCWCDSHARFLSRGPSVGPP